MIRIFKTSLSSSSDSPEVLTAELGQQTSPGRRGSDPKSSGHRSPGGGASLLSNKRLTFPFLAFVAVLAAGLLFLMPGGLAQAQNSTAIEFMENDTTAVATFTAADPEGVMPIVWSLVTTLPEPVPTVGGAALVAADFEDAEDFNISQSGVLTFAIGDDDDPPNFEAPAGGADNDSNTYNVVVRASDGGVMEKVEYFKVTVDVRDVPEDERLTMMVDPDGAGTAPAQTLLQFRPDAVLSVVPANPTGGDITTAVPATNIRWQWYRSSSKSARGTPINGATTATYTVLDSPANPNDMGKYIHVVATYTDRTGDDRTASAVSANPVQVSRQDNAVPEFISTAQTRAVNEGPEGMMVGAPVTARDADGDVRTYTLAGDDNDSFRIDRATGQITTTAELNFEDAADSGGTAEDNIYVVTVTATDSIGGVSPVATVNIHVLNVEEKPMLAGPRASDHTEGTVAIDGDLATEDVQPATYTASDPEGETVTLSLTGDDAALFEIAADTDATAAASQVLSFREAPDFENPGDMNGDNIYEVTVRASDGAKYTDWKVTVKVTDTDETGKVELSSQDAQIGVELTATLTDSDGGVPDPARFTDQKWTWHRLATAAEIPDTSDDDTNNTISKATSSSYTPVVADRGMFLKAMVTYTDRTRDEDNNDDNNAVATFVGFQNPATSDATIAVRDNDANQQPEFAEGAMTFRVVEENTTALSGAANDDAAGETDSPADNAGGPVEATDDDGDTLTYTLGGADAGMFRVRANGQIEVGSEANLDHETRTSHTVTLTADDNRGAANSTASITVTIYVTDLDEEPTIMVGGLSIIGMASVEYAEGRMDAVDTYTAAGPRADIATWTLEGDDAGAFTISGGVLEFMTPPDYEMPADADMDNTYMVTVKADDGTYMDMQDVTVMVTNMKETGTVTLSSMSPMVGTELTAMLDDPDKSVTMTGEGEGWQWSKSMTMDGEYMDIDGAAMMSYTPVADDDGYHLRATATYTDGYGGDTAMATTAGMVATVQDQPGTVSLSSMDPVVGVELTASLSDADGSVTEAWQWSKSMDMNSWTDITGATSMSYTPVAEDEGYYLRATLTYTDNHGPDVKTEMAMTTNKVVADADALLVARYDTNGTPGIQKDEVITAINDYLFGTGDDAPSKAEVIRLINLYLFGS